LYKQLNGSDRDLIAIWKSQGLSNKVIAKKLKRSVSTIGREIRRNISENRHYVAIWAQVKVENRKRLSRARHPLKNKHLFASVISNIKAGWSPEIIAGRLNKKHGKKVIVAETIYTFIYSNHPKAKELKLWEYLPRHKRRRTRKDGRKSKKVRIPGRISIHDRPGEINIRVSPGHWEGDTMESKAHKGGLHIEVERIARLILARKVSSMESVETIRAQKEIFAKIPDRLKRTITMDNGRENHLHQELNGIGIKTYFADPYSAWQKGSVENAIGILRRYFPKGTDLSQVAQDEIDEVVWEINNRPRKILDYQTPQEVYNTYKGCTSN